MALGVIKILHLYPNELNLYGDSGNVLCLYYRLKKRGFNAEIVKAGKGDKIPDFDILFIGGGQDREISIIEKDLKRKSDAISYYIESGKTVLAICGGYQLLGEYFKTNDNRVIRLSGALPFYTEGSKKRMIGNIVMSTPFGKIVGFENHSGRTHLSEELNPLGSIIMGYGNNGSDGKEGLLYKNTFCTYLHGPVLPKNPKFADEILRRSVPQIDHYPLDDNLETLCHNSLIARFSRLRK